MKVNKTVALDLNLIKMAQEKAKEEGRSFSSWINQLIKTQLPSQKNEPSLKKIGVE